MLKDVTKTIVRCANEDYIKHMTYWLPGWQEICKWPTETRFTRFDQFLDFIATVCRWFVPAQAEKGWYVVGRYIFVYFSNYVFPHSGICWLVQH